MITWKEVRKKLDSRSLRERAFLLVAVIVVIGYSWYFLVFETLDAQHAETRRQIRNTVSQVNAEITRSQNIRNSYTRDPNAFIRTRIGTLQRQVDQIDSELLSLYGELILPQQMAGVLTEILQSETSLNLVSFENLPPEVLFESDGDDQAEDVQANIKVYRQGLKMEFEGEYLETIRFLRKVEGLSTSFFWDALTYRVEDYPEGRITLNIFTLSTEKGFIGV